MKGRSTIFGVSSWRHYFFYSALIILGLALGGRIVFLGEADKEFLQKKGKTSEKSEIIPEDQGSIIDRNREVLSVTTPA